MVEPTKREIALRRTCPTCHVAPGEMCRRATVDSDGSRYVKGYDVTWTGELAKSIHKSRRSDTSTDVSLEDQTSVAVHVHLLPEMP